MRDLTLEVGFSCSSGPDGGLLSDPVAPFLEETIEVPMWVGSSSSLSGLSSLLLTSSLSSPGCSRLELSWLPLLGFDLAGLVASGSAELETAQSFHSVRLLCHILAFVRCGLGSPPCSLTHCGASWLVA